MKNVFGQVLGAVSALLMVLMTGVSVAGSLITALFGAITAVSGLLFILLLTALCCGVPALLMSAF